jgi:dipeptidase D
MDPAHGSLLAATVATIAIKAEQLPALENAVAVAQTEWQQKLQNIDDQLQISLQQNANPINEVITLQQQQAWLQALASFR